VVAVLRHEARADDGFSMVEIVIAMFLLAIVAVALLPALWQGVSLSGQQSATATATRQLNALVEQARESPSCGLITSVAASQQFTDGAERTITTSGVVGTCAPGAAVQLRLVAVDSSGRTLATTSARVFVP
jgi:prepilin-type N-terminal cleavage/methylation domain-containing protein